MMTQTIGGPFDCYPPGWPPYTPPCYPHYQPAENTIHTHAPVLSIQEQMGADPISKLAAAIEKLADALSRGGNHD